MRYTPRILVLLGVACLVYVFLNLNAGAFIDSANRRVANAAKQAAAGMTVAELGRVFEMPGTTPDARAWMEWHLGRDRVVGVLGQVWVNIAVTGGLGVTLIALGFVERAARRAA